MEHTKYFQSGSKESEGRVLKYQKIHLQASIFEMLLGLHRGLVICCLYKTHDIFPKWLQRRWKHDPKRTENPCPSLHFKMLLGLGASLGTPWRPSWDGDLKNHQTITFLDLLFGAYLWQVLHFCGDVFCNVFRTPLLPTFWSQRQPRTPIWSSCGYKFDDISNKCGKVATAFSLERGHQNQAFQGLCFTMIYQLLIRVIETCNCHPASKALLTLCSIYGLTWPSFWTQNCNTFHLFVVMIFS